MQKNDQGGTWTQLIPFTFLLSGPIPPPLHVCVEIKHGRWSPGSSNHPDWVAGFSVWHTLCGCHSFFPVSLPPQSPLPSHCLAPGLTSIALHKSMLAKWRNCKNLPVKLEGVCRVMTGASAKWGKWAEEKERSDIYIWKMQRTFPLPTLSWTLWGISVP